MQGPTAFREGASAEPIRSLSRTTSMLKPTDRTTHILVSEDSISASVVPIVERLLAVGLCPRCPAPLPEHSCLHGSCCIARWSDCHVTHQRPLWLFARQVIEKQAKLIASACILQAVCHLAVCMSSHDAASNTNCVCLQDAETNWQFDIFGFAEQAQGSALFLLTFHFMQKFTAWQEWAVDKTKLATFVRVIEKGYDAKNPYHNRWVLHSLSCWPVLHQSVCLCCTWQLLCTHAAVLMMPC